jgi:hypothetical protein
MNRRVFIAIATASSLGPGLACGCGRPAIDRYRVTGPVTCGGTPVVTGEVLFTPDGARRNGGPQGVAVIRNGRFDTAGSRAPGVGGGATTVRVTGALDEAGRKVVRHEFTIELARGDQEIVIEIPTAVEALAAGPEI